MHFHGICDTNLYCVNLHDGASSKWSSRITVEFIVVFVKRFLSYLGLSSVMSLLCNMALLTNSNNLFLIALCLMILDVID